MRSRQIGNHLPPNCINTTKKKKPPRQQNPLKSINSKVLRKLNLFHKSPSCVEFLRGCWHPRIRGCFHLPRPLASPSFNQLWCLRRRWFWPGFWWGETMEKVIPQLVRSNYGNYGDWCKTPKNRCGAPSKWPNFMAYKWGLLTRKESQSQLLFEKTLLPKNFGSMANRWVPGVHKITLTWSGWMLIFLRLIPGIQILQLLLIMAILQFFTSPILPIRNATSTHFSVGSYVSWSSRRKNLPEGEGVFLLKKGSIVKGNESSELTINFHGQTAVSFLWSSLKWSPIILPNTPLWK